MLDKVRKPGRGKNIAAYIVFGLICFVFVFMGVVPDQSGFSGAGAAATVNDTVISMQDFQELLSREQTRFSDNQGSSAERRRRERDLRQGVIQRLVTFEVFYQYGVDAGIYPVNNAIRDMIINIPQFQENGQFQREYYDRYLTFARTSAGDFERKVGRDVVIGSLQGLFAAAWKASPVVDGLDAEANGTKLEVDFVKINRDELAKTMTKADRVRKWLADAENKKKVEESYQGRLAEFKTEEQVRARHILIKGEDDAALKKAQEMYDKAKSGDFAKLAGEFSQDEGSKSKGGDLGFFGRGRMVKEFEDAAFRLDVGAISEPVKSAFGYHVIKLEEKRGGETKPLSEVQDQIASEIIAQAEFDKVVTSFEEKLKNGESIEPLLKDYGMKWQSTGEFNLRSFIVPKLEAGEEAINAVLSNPKTGSTVPNLIASGPNRYVLKLKKLTRPTTKQNETEPNFLFGGGSELLFKWADEKRKEARIHINDVVLN